MELVAVVFHFVGWLAIIVTLWATAPRGNTHDVILTFSNSGGWQSTGLACMIGVVTPVGLLIGYDCSVHMCKLSFATHPAWPEELTETIESNS